MNVKSGSSTLKYDVAQRLLWAGCELLKCQWALGLTCHVKVTADDANPLHKRHYPWGHSVTCDIIHIGEMKIKLRKVSATLSLMRSNLSDAIANTDSLARILDDDTLEKILDYWG